MKKFLLLLVMACIMMPFATSCSHDNEDGLWAPMEWTAKGVKATPGMIKCDPLGDVIEMTCTNYETLWFVAINSEDVAPEAGLPPHEVANDWFTAETVGNTLKITVQSLPEKAKTGRTAQFTVSAGECFSTFVLVQNP